jgi:hypothetical protein
MDHVDDSLLFRHVRMSRDDLIFGLSRNEVVNEARTSCRTFAHVNSHEGDEELLNGSHK